ADTGFKASIALERPPDINGSWIIGDGTKSHVEIQHARAALTLGQDLKGALFDASLGADHVVVDIELGGDSFLSSVLPPSLRIDTQLGLGVDTRRGFYLNGGVALVVDLPVNVTIGPAAVLDLLLQALHLRLGFTTADPAGDPGTGAFSVSFTIAAAVHVAGGVFTATVAGIGVAFSIKQTPPTPSGTTSATAGHWQPQLSFVPPSGLGVVVKAGPVGGGGYIGYDADRGEYTGALQLHIGLSAISVDITALGMLDTKIPGSHGDWALLLLL